jgi:hypothetical protein
MDKLDEWIFLLLGTALGLLTSYIFWWVWNHKIIPNILFSDFISKSFNAQEKAVYRVKIYNASRRGVIDLEFIARLEIKGLSSPKMWSFFDIETNAKKVPFIAPRGNRIVLLRPNETGDFSRDIFPYDIVQKRVTESLDLESLLQIGSQAVVCIYLFCYDEYSGARKLYISKRYTLSDIHEKRFLTLTRLQRGFASGLRLMKTPAKLPPSDA